LNEHIEEDGPIEFNHACKLGLEGIVLEAQGFQLPLWTFAAWIKVENSACAAVAGEAAEDWGR
jgi:hypothetical protein